MRNVQNLISYAVGGADNVGGRVTTKADNAMEAIEEMQVEIGIRCSLKITWCF